MWPSHPGFEDEFHADIPSRLPRLAVRNEWPDRLLLLDLAARPVSVNFQPRYKCTAKDLLSCITTPPPNMRPPLCPRKAVHHLSRFLNPRHKRSDEYLDARRRLNKAITKARETGDFDPRLAIKAFKDLDTIFFAGKLTGNTRVSWAGRREMKRRHGDPDEMCLGMTEYLGDGTAWIVLSSYTILVLKPDPFMTMWETLLHEMVVSFPPFCRLSSKQFQ
ncbi:MAG: hypothetical protein LQ351_005162 [Letrouitia transgressa]|nr:MAG: hypothetical protein LQ351_005162 [Letrouitia transgressa]